MKKGFILFVVLLYALYASAGNLELYFGDNKCVNGATYVSALQMTDQYEWKGVTYTSWEQDSRLFLHGDVGTQVSLEVTTDAAVQFCGIDGQCVMTQPNVTKTKTGALKSTVEDTVIDKMFETEGNENPEDISEPITVHVTAWETSKPSEKISVKVIMSNSLTPVGPECYYFSVENKVARKGRVTMLPVEMINDDGVVSFQCDVVLPEGVCVHKEDGAYAIEASDRFDNTHTLSSSQLDNGKIRIVSISMQNHAYK
ncbi:MAG: hypothetical protein HUJ98_12995, partial [Bacteroidaceae bacterium]|nr:hypothetical protein [Bacteroidaceae bacterium]